MGFFHPQQQTQNNSGKVDRTCQNKCWFLFKILHHTRRGEWGLDQLMGECEIEPRVICDLSTINTSANSH